MSQPTRPLITGLQSVSAASTTMAAMPTTEDANSLGRARMIRHTQGGRRVLRLVVGINVSGGWRLHEPWHVWRSCLSARERSNRRGVAGGWELSPEEA